MNTFHGSLAHYRMSLVMPALLECGPAPACLAVERGPVRRWFMFQSGRLVATSSNQPNEHLGQMLVDLEMMDSLSVASAFENAEREGKPLGTYLIQKKLLDEEELLRALKQKARHAFFDCYLWESGEMELWAASSEQDLGGLQLDLAHLHSEATLYQAQWQLGRKEPGVGMEELSELARKAWGEGDLKRAAGLVNEALQRGSFSDGQALYRKIEEELCAAMSQKIECLKGALTLAPLPNPPPRQLTPNDLGLYFKLQSAGEMVELLRLSLKQLAVYSSIQRLCALGLLLTQKRNAELCF